MVENPTVIRLIKISVDKNLEDIEAHFISDDWGKFMYFCLSDFYDVLV
jgi:hypothetical protein